MELQPRMVFGILETEVKVFFEQMFFTFFLFRWIIVLGKNESKIKYELKISSTNFGPKLNRVYVCIIFSLLQNRKNKCYRLNF